MLLYLWTKLRLTTDKACVTHRPPFLDALVDVLIWAAERIIPLFF